MRSIIVISASENDIKELENHAKEMGIGFKVVGRVKDNPHLSLKIGNTEIQENMEEIRKGWENRLKELLD